MVKRKFINSVAEDDIEPNTLNENGNLPAGSDNNKDGKKRIKTKSLYRQPTANELNRLQETENLFNSNLFRLQIEEILEEVKVKEKTTKRFQEWFTTFKAHLLSIPEDEKEYDLSEKIYSNHIKVKVPISKALENTKIIFKFHKFSDVKVVGSYGLGCSINSKLSVDVQIVVPAEMYVKNDSINYKYHKKRAAYLAYIASHLINYEEIDSVQYSFKKGFEAKPILVIKPNGKLGNHLSVHLDIVCEFEAYKLHRFSPNRNNVRESWLLSKNQENTEIGPPTPYYNSSILSDLTHLENYELLTETLSNCANLKQAIVLLKIWVRQRNLQVSGFVISIIIAYLVQTKRINNIMSSYQIVRNVWIALKASEWDKKGVTLCKDQGTPPIEEFHENFPAVFLDKSGYYNILWQMSEGTYHALKRECDLAIGMLDNSKINSFIPLFMTPIKLLTQFDHILMFKDLNNIKQSVVEKASKSARVNYGLDELALVTDNIYNLLSKGLGNRVDLILQVVEADFTWSVKKSLEKAKKEGYKEKLSFGFILNPENAINLVDRGPPANLPEAEEFRAFWGDKSELRRFQDGSITEACVWSAASLADRRGIPALIVDYLLHLKYDIQSDNLFHVCDQLDDLLARKSAQGQQMEETTVAVLQAFDELRRDLRGLTQLPLDVTSVYGISPVFSYSDPFPALPAPTTRRHRGAVALLDHNATYIPEYTPANVAVVELTHSGKWPGDINAFRCLKAAFNLQISTRLNKQYNLITQAYQNHIDVLKNGLVFRLIIAHSKEITLLRREVEKGVVKFKESEESLKLQNDNFLLPRLRGALHGLHQKYPSYGPTVCLLKRWLSCQLLADHFPSPAVELLAAIVYLQAAPLSPPSTPTVGLFRVLQYFASKDWGSEMVLLDFNDEMSREQVSEIERKFSARDEAAPYLCVATAHDGAAPGAWTQAPRRPAVRRAQLVAAAALAFLGKCLLEDMKHNVLEVFVPSLSGYDVVIHLIKRLVPYHTERLDSKPVLNKKNLSQDTSEDIIPVVEFNPVREYLEELKSAYGELAVFFHDAYGGDVVAVLWKPETRELKHWQVSTAHASHPVEVNGETKYRVNINAIIEDFKILGKGLVRDVTVQS